MRSSFISCIAISRPSGRFRFYADKLNVSAPYLSRMIKDISGTTVNDHITSLLYKEICNLLKQSDMTMEK